MPVILKLSKGFQSAPKVESLYQSKESKLWFPGNNYPKFLPEQGQGREWEEKSIRRIMTPTSNSFIETQHIQDRDLGAAWAVPERRLVIGCKCKQLLSQMLNQQGGDDRTFPSCS